MKKIILLLIVLFASTGMQAQSIGGFIGGGIINANSPNISSASGSFFFETGTLFNSNASLRLSFLYAVDMNKILPSSTNKYFPFLRGITLKGISSQPMSKTLYIEEGVGAIIINDRIFSDVNEIDFGFVISVSAGIDLRNIAPTGFRIGAGTDYGFTFTNSYAKYFALYLQGQYYF